MNSSQSTTPSTKPMTHDKIYYFLPYWDNKPCMHTVSVWPDFRRRMYNSNIISRIVDKLVRSLPQEWPKKLKKNYYLFCVSLLQEEGLAEVHSLLETEDLNAEKKLKAVLEELSTSCGRYITVTKGNSSGPGCGKTKLDKERIKLCQREIVSIFLRIA